MEQLEQLFKAQTATGQSIEDTPKRSRKRYKAGRTAEFIQQNRTSLQAKWSEFLSNHDMLKTQDTEKTKKYWKGDYLGKIQFPRKGLVEMSSCEHDDASSSYPRPEFSSSDKINSSEDEKEAEDNHEERVEDIHNNSTEEVHDIEDEELNTTMKRSALR